MALGGAAEASTSFHAANAEGTFAYHVGTFALRKEHYGETWKIDRENGVESIRNDADRIKVVFANVDIACSDARDPKPRSSKGSGSEKLCAGNDLFGGLPRYVETPEKTATSWTVYYLMVAPNGAVELSCPIVKDDTFKKLVERIYLSDGSDFDTEPRLSLDDQDIADDFDPQVARKK